MVLSLGSLFFLSQLCSNSVFGPVVPDSTFPLVLGAFGSASSYGHPVSAIFDHCIALFFGLARFPGFSGCWHLIHMSFFSIPALKVNHLHLGRHDV